MDLKVGDIIAISSPKGFLPKAIRYFMKIWGKKRYNKKFDKYYNHTMIVVDEDNLEIAEAIGKGYVIRSFLDHYGEKLEHLIVFRLKDPLKGEELVRFQEKVEEMANRNIEYEFTNFLWQAIYVLSNGKWDWSPRGSKREKRVFCFETSCTILDYARELFDDPSVINTVDLMVDERFMNFKIIKNV